MINNKISQFSGKALYRKTPLTPKNKISSLYSPLDKEG